MFVYIINAAFRKRHVPYKKQESWKNRNIPKAQGNWQMKLILIVCPYPSYPLSQKCLKNYSVYKAKSSQFGLNHKVCRITQLK